ncbi:MAG: DNA mismatch repair endonuclease MutL [Candidatus Dojkabacteria bacterium]
MSKIRTLPENLINMIAAGEVVERPASAAKELIENSIDAGATEIILKIEDFGKKLIEISDNGVGMDKDDALKAFEQHTTSKISQENDLYNIVTLGFRGEALASISSVADSIIIETKSKDIEAVKLNIKNTHREFENSARTDNGTIISISSLFKNVPARLKFLKSDATELKYITTTFTDIALSHLNIRFEMYHNGKLLYRLPNTTSAKDRIFDIYGKNVAESLFNESHFDGKSYQITALFCKPELAKKISTIQYISLNGRAINSKIISVAVQQAYQGFIHKDLKPHYFLFIHMDPSIVDVNVHPRKLEVRFENQDQIFKDIFRLTRNSLENSTKLDTGINREEEIKSSEVRENITNQGSSNFKSNYIYPKNNYSFKEKGQKVNDLVNFQNILNEAPSFNTAYRSTERLNNLATSNLELETNFKPFQVLNTYIVFESKDKVTFIDQHAAAEKILFEKILFGLGDIKTKPMLVPEVVGLKNEDKALILEKADDLKRIGIGVEDFGGKDIQITEVPEELEDLDVRKYIDAILNNNEDFSHLSHVYAGVPLSSELYYLVAITACHGSIRAGQKLSETEMKKIIEDLPGLKNSQSCPHGRPIRWVLNKSDIEKNFKRII